MNKEFLAALGLKETATAAEAIAAVQALQNKAALNAAKPGAAAQTQTDTTGNKVSSVDLAAYAPRADLNAMEGRALAAEKQLAELNAARFKKDVEAAVDEAIKNRKIPPASRAGYLALCATGEGLETFKKIAATAPAIISAETQAPEGTPPTEGSAALNAEEAGLAKAMGYSAEEFQKIKEGNK